MQVQPHALVARVGSEPDVDAAWYTFEDGTYESRFQRNLEQGMRDFAGRSLESEDSCFLFGVCGFHEIILRSWTLDRCANAAPPVLSEVQALVA